MFPTKYRLSKTKDIETVQKTGKSFFTKLFIIKYAPNNLDYSRFTVVVSNKVAKSAVVRNRLKRFLREQLQLNSPKIRPGYDVLVSVSRGALDNMDNIDRPNLAKTLSFALDKGNLLKK